MLASWQDEDRYWREHYSRQPYARGRTYEDLQSGYRFGYEAAQRTRLKRWEDVEPQLAGEWNQYENNNRSTWAEVKDAVRDAWDRIVVATVPRM